jgi:hypothetical protein
MIKFSKNYIIIDHLNLLEIKIIEEVDQDLQE